MDTPVLPLRRSSLSGKQSGYSALKSLSTRRKAVSAIPIAVLLLIWLLFYRDGFGLQDVPALASPGDGPASPGDGLADNLTASVDLVAAEKVAAEKVAAEKVAAEKVAAEKVAAEKERAALAMKEAFIKDFVTTDIRGTYDGQALYDLCASDNATWNRDLVFECPALEGGYGNVRNAALQCIRLAIEARGSLVMPQISRRSQTDIAQFRTSDKVPFDYLFDTAHLQRTLKTYCPQLELHDSVPDRPSLKTSFSVTPYELPGLAGPRGGRIIGHPSKYKSAFDSWLEKVNTEKLSPVRVPLQPGTIWSWPTSYDSPSLVRSFSRLIRFPREVRQVAAEALYNLHTAHGREPLKPGKIPTEYGFTLPFVGIHLRAEEDATKYHLTNFSLQTDYYIARLRSDLVKSFVTAGSTGGIVSMYIASGDRGQIDAFLAKLGSSLPEVRFRVSTKDTLLRPAQLSSLTWDQQALIDFQVLERARYVMGVRESSFAWTLALKRAAAANWVVGGFPSGPCWTAPADEGQDGPADASDDKQGGKRRGCKEDLAPYEYWRDDLTALVGDLGEAANESVDVVRSSIWP